MTRPYNPPEVQRLGMGRIIIVEHQDDLVMVTIPSPSVWKTIGEASASLDANGLWIEKVDGFRVAVRRHPMFRNYFH